MKKLKKYVEHWIMEQGWSTVEPHQVMERFPRIDPEKIMGIYNNVLSCQWEKIVYGKEFETEASRRSSIANTAED